MSGKTVVEFTRLTENALTPKKATSGSAGVDLYSSERVKIPAYSKALIDTSIAMILPPNTCGIIQSRSGLALNFNVHAFVGVIDQDYRGSLKVLLYNHGNTDFTVLHNMRIAQLIVQKVCDPYFVEVDTVPTTERLANGFGSSGLMFNDI